MWINNNISKPLRKGNYKTLVDFDGLGNLIEMEDEFLMERVGICIILLFNLFLFGGRKKKITKPSLIK